jgi:hypothetical protein
MYFILHCVQSWIYVFQKVHGQNVFKSEISIHMEKSELGGECIFNFLL